MRKTLTGLLAVISITALAQTKTPVQLLSPTAGQTIVSTGPNTVPSWANVTATALGPQPANTAVANVTGSSAAPTATALPSCSTGNSALKYTSGTGFSCGTTFALTSGNLSQFASTTSAQLLGVLSDETGSGAAVFGTSPSLTTPTIAGASLSGTFSGTPTFSGAVTFSSTVTPSQTAGIVGTTTNNNANAGAWGEYNEAKPAAVGMTTNVSANVASVSLGAGDWFVFGNAVCTAGTGDSITNLASGISTTSATLPGSTETAYSGTISVPAGLGAASQPPAQRFLLSTTTTVYLVGNIAHTGGTATCQGRISYWRRR